MSAGKYRKVGQTLVNPLLLSGDHCAFDLAKLFYAQYSDLNFEYDLNEYFRNGFVISRPRLFCMFKPILYGGERMWFVRILIGDLGEALTCMPCFLSKIAFCRNNDDNMRIVDTKRLCELAVRKIKRGK